MNLTLIDVHMFITCMALFWTQEKNKLIDGLRKFNTFVSRGVSILGFLVIF